MQIYKGLAPARPDKDKLITRARHRWTCNVGVGGQVRDLCTCIARDRQTKRG